MYGTAIIYNNNGATIISQNLCDLNNKIGSTGPIVAYYWKTSEVKARKLKIHYEKENKGNQSNNSI